MNRLSLSNVIAIVASLLGALFVSCQEHEIDTQATTGTKYIISGLDIYEVAGTSAADIIFNISSNREWTIKSDQQWCQVTPSSSSSSSLISDIVVSCDDNSDINSTRVANLTVSVEGKDVKSIKITQERKGALTVTPISEEIPAGGATASFIISTNRDWEITCSEPWIIFDKVRGGQIGEFASYTINATVAANSLDRRTAEIIVVSGEEKKSFKVVQNGVTFVVEQPAENMIPSTGGAITLGVNANIEWDENGVSCEDTPNATFRKIDNETLEVKLPTNNKFSLTKTSTIKIVPKDAVYASLERTVELVQDRALALDFLAPNGSATVNADGSLKITSSAGAKSRVSTNSKYGFGTFIWRFSEINCTGKGHFELHGDGGDHRYRMFLSQTQAATNNSSFLIKSVGLGVINPASPFTFTREQLSQMKELKVDVRPSADNAKVVITVYADGVQIAQDRNLTNAWADPNKARPTLYFGFAPGASDSESSMTIESFDIIEYTAE